MTSLPSSWIRADDFSSGFLLELFVYLSSVSRSFSLVQGCTQPTSLPDVVLKKIDQGKDHLQLPGFMFGYAYELHMLIPQIHALAMEQHSPVNNNKTKSEIVTRFRAIQVHIQQWKPPENTDGGECDTLGVSARMYQQALYVFLYCAIHGPGKPNPLLVFEVDSHVRTFLELMTCLPRTCFEWTTMSWPLIIVGSCVHDEAQRKNMTTIAAETIQQMYGTSSCLKILHWLWESTDPEAYGPWGVEKIMTERHVRLSVG
jgi:hypothetical protein